VALYLLLGCAMPEPRVSCLRDGAVAVDIQQDDESPTHLAWAELVDVHAGTTVWRIEQDQSLQTDTLWFHADQDADEPVAPSYGSVRIVQPVTRRLRLRPDTKYEVLLKGYWWQPARRAEFRLSQCAAAVDHSVHWP